MRHHSHQPPLSAAHASSLACFFLLVLLVSVTPAGLEAADPAKEAFALAGSSDPAAIQSLRVLAAAHPRNAEVLHALGRGLVKHGRYGKALQSFERSLAIEGSPLWLTGWNHYFLGLTNAKLGHRDKAMKHLEEALHLKATRNCTKAAVQLWTRLTGKAPQGFAPPQNALVGKPCPPVELCDLAGNSLNTRDFPGEVVALQVGASW